MHRVIQTHKLGVLGHYEPRKIKEIEQMTWDALHKLAAKAAENGEEKAGNYLHVLFGPYATAFGGTCINRMFGNAI